MHIRRRSFLAGLTAAVLAAGPACAAGEAAAAPPGTGERIGVEITVSKASAEAGRYTCTTTVKDLVSQQVLAAPRIQFRPGEPAQLHTTDPASGLAIEISVAVTGAGEQVDHVVLVRRGGELVASQSVTVHLPL